MVNIHGKLVTGCWVMGIGVDDGGGGVKAVQFN